MIFRALGLTIICIAAACHAAEPSGEERGEHLVSIAKAHLAADDLKRTVAQLPTDPRNKEVAYESVGHGRFATYRLSPEGQLTLFVVNQREAYPYVPIKDRAAFIETMMEAVAPNTAKAERAWGAKQLDSLWKFPANPLPVQVGSYVFKGRSGGSKGVHDTLIITAVDEVTTGLKYRPAR